LFCGDVVGSINAMDQQEASPLRRWPRYRFQVPVRITVNRDRYVATLTAVGTEMNEGGMALYAGIELTVGDQLQLEFELQNCDHPIGVRGVVCNRPGDGYYYGIAFLPVSAEERGSLVLLRQMLRSAVGHLDS